MRHSDTPQTPHTPLDSFVSRLRHKTGQAAKLRAREPTPNHYGRYDFIHPEFGVLTIVFDHEIKDLAAISFTPTRNVIYKLVPSVDWYFRKGKCSGTGIGQTEWEGWWCKDQKSGQ